MALSCPDQTNSQNRSIFLWQMFVSRSTIDITHEIWLWPDILVALIEWIKSVMLFFIFMRSVTLKLVGTFRYVENIPNHFYFDCYFLWILTSVFPNFRYRSQEFHIDVIVQKTISNSHLFSLVYFRVILYSEYIGFVQINHKCFILGTDRHNLSRNTTNVLLYIILNY